MRVLRRSRATLVLTVAVCLLVGTAGSVTASVGGRGIGAAAAAAAPVDESGITFRAFRSFEMPIVPGEPFWLNVRSSVPSGPMHFAELIDGEEVFLADANWQPGGVVNGVPIADASFQIENPSEGTHTYLAVFAATDDWDALTLSLDVAVEQASLDITIVASENPIQTHHSVFLSANIEGAGTGTEMTGQFEWRDGDNGSLIASRSANEYPLTIPSLAVGVHAFTLTYTGDATRAPSTSPVFALTVVPDIVEATGVGAQYERFFPVTDGYRDTVALKGNRAEPIDVVIRVYSPTGALIRTFTVAKGTGAYSQAWNGRDTSGRLLAAGKYKVVQSLTDEFGVKKNKTFSIELLHSKLVQYTTDVVLDARAMSASGSGGGGSVTTSSASGGYAKLSAGSGWAVAGWEFQIPRATVYKSVSILVNAKAGFSVPPTYLGIQNFATCPRTDGDWSASCFERWTTIGNAGVTAAWFATPGSASAANRSGQYVRGMISVEFGTVYVYEARARIVYQVLEPAVLGAVVVPAR